MSNFASIQTARPALAEKIKGQGYFVTVDDVKRIVEIDRLHRVLVRCGGGRFACGAQDVEHFLAVIEASKMDYLRDLSIEAN